MRSGPVADLLSRGRGAGRAVMRVPVAAALGLCALFIGSNGTQDANANGETRSLTMLHAHTNETITITYKQNGSFVSESLQKLNWFLRDWRIDEPTSMSPHLFDIIWYVYREVGADSAVRVMSAYRSPGTNAMLRRRSRAVAKESQHMRGNAMDVHIPGVSMARVREIGMRLQRGGVGYYPSAGSPFVHLDVGSVRSWPRMPRPQLERLFPDGKTVHLPADGVPLANYEAALAEVQARGGSALDYGTVTANRGKSLWALLFGGDEDDDTREAIGRGGRNARVAARGRGNVPQVAAVPAPSSGDGVNAWGVVSRAESVPIVTEARPVPAAAAPVAVAALPAAPVPQKQPEPKAAPEPKVSVEIASLPVPPIRPRGARFEALVAAAEPIPPIRPGAIGMTLPASPPEPKVTEAPAVSAHAAVSGMPVPPLRPVLPTSAPGAEPAPQAVAVARPVDMPLPPSRPAEPRAVAALPGILARSEEGRPAPDLARSYAAIAAPSPPVRPAAPRPTPVEAAPPAAPAAIAPPVVPRAPAVTRRTDPSVLVGVRPTAQARPAQVTAVTEPPVEREVRRPVTAMSFSQGPARGGAGSGGFTGTFIRPMGMSFSSRGE